MRENAPLESPRRTACDFAPMAGLVVSILVYPFAVWWLRRFFSERLGIEQNVGVLVFLLASIVSWAAAEVVGRL